MFRGNRSTGSGDEDFLRVFTIYGCGGHHEQTLVPPTQGGSNIKFGFDWSSGFREDV